MISKHYLCNTNQQFNLLNVTLHTYIPLMDGMLVWLSVWGKVQICI